ncbi:NPHP3, partial [Symbiodinium necroappetens]
MARPALCRQAFGGTSDDLAQLNQVAENMASDEEVKAMEDLVAQVGKAAEFVEAQEHQAWCELPLREMSCALATESLGEESEPALNAANHLMVCLMQTGHGGRAVGMGTRLLEIEERHYGADHLWVAMTLSNLGNAYGELGDYQRQKELLERCLRIGEQHYSADHPKVVMTLSNLGTAYGDLGDYQRKKELLERCLRIGEQHYGADHPEVATMLNNLGNAYGDLGDHQREKELLERCLKIKEQHYGADHPEVAKILNNLGNAYGDLGDYQRGKELLERCLRIGEQHYGADHPEVAMTLNNLGNAYGEMGDHQRMKELLEQCLKIKEKHYGLDHPEVSKILNNLGAACGKLGDYQRKKELLEQGLKIEEQHYGADHPEVATILNNLGTACGELGDHQRAKELLERCLKIKEQHYGADHPDVASIINNLGSAYGLLGDYQRQKELLERSLEIFQRSLGPGHPSVDLVPKAYARVATAKDSQGKGFTWLDALRSVDCDAQAKEATCVFPQMGTIFTHQVLTREDACDFVLQVVDAGGEGEEPICVGVVSDEPVGFWCLPVGHPQLASSIGIVSAGPHAGHIVQAGQLRRVEQGIASGDTIRIQIEPGSTVKIWHGPTVLGAFVVGGNGMFRCAASLSSIGQRVRIVDSAQDASAAAAVSRMVDPRRAGQTSPSNPAVPAVRDEQKKAEEQDGSPCSPAKVAAAEDKELEAVKGLVRSSKCVRTVIESSTADLDE